MHDTLLDVSAEYDRAYFARIAGYTAELLLAARAHRLKVLITAAVLVIAALIAATQLRINNNLLDYLDPASELRGNVERIHDELSGVHSFSIVVDSGIDPRAFAHDFGEEAELPRGAGEFASQARLGQRGFLTGAFDDRVCDRLDLSRDLLEKRSA